MGADQTSEGQTPDDAQKPSEPVDLTAIDWAGLPLDDPRWELLDDVDDFDSELELDARQQDDPADAGLIDLSATAAHPLSDDVEPVADDVDEGVEFSGPPPDPATRTWRHPAEVAAARAHMDRFLAEDARNSHPSAGNTYVGGGTANANRWMVAVAAGALVIAGLTAWNSNRETVAEETAAATNVDPEPDTVAVSRLPAVSDTAAAAVAPTTSTPVASTASDDSGLFAVVKSPIVSPPLWAYEVLSGQDDLASEALGTAIRIDGLDSAYLITSTSALAGRTEVMLAQHTRSSRNAVLQVRPELMAATVVAADPTSGIAVLHTDVSGADMPAAPIGGQGRGLMGADVEVWSGVPSTQHRGTILSIDVRLMETSAPVPTGSLGAGVVNRRGGLVGVITDRSSSLAAALPADEALRVAGNLALYGVANPNWLGITIADRDGFVTVLDVEPDGPADVAGIQPGDLVIGANNSILVTVDQLTDIVADVVNGSEMGIVVQRNGELLGITAVVGQRPESELLTLSVDT